MEYTILNSMPFYDPVYKMQNIYFTNFYQFIWYGKSTPSKITVFQQWVDLIYDVWGIWSRIQTILHNLNMLKTHAPLNFKL